MPSETVYGRSSDIDTRVSWGNNGSGTVQVATLDGSEGPGRLIGIVNEWLKMAEMPEINLAELVRRAPNASFDGWHCELADWAEANRLIKVLKRARDQAFGSPE